MLPLLLLSGCGTSQHAWQVDKWGPAEAEVRTLTDLDIKDVELPKRITGNKEPGDEARWLKEWPVLFANELVDGLNREGSDYGLATRGVRKSGPYVFEFKVDTLSVGGSAYSSGSINGVAEIKKADGTLVVRLFGAWASMRGMGEPDVEVWLDDMGMQLARWIYLQR